MSATGIFTVGRDGSVVIAVTGFGNLTLPLLTTFRSTQRFVKQRSTPLNATPIEAELPDGWTWEADLDRATRVIDDLASYIEANFWGGGTIGNCQVTQYIKENDGSTATYSFAPGSLSISTGTFTKDDKVAQKLMGFSPTRRKVS